MHHIEDHSVERCPSIDVTGRRKEARAPHRRAQGGRRGATSRVTTPGDAAQNLKGTTKEEAR
eukprot:3323954-Rhodomonas_salina.2